MSVFSSDHMGLKPSYISCRLGRGTLRGNGERGRGDESEVLLSNCAKRECGILLLEMTVVRGAYTQVQKHLVALRNGRNECRRPPEAASVMG